MVLTLNLLLLLHTVHAEHAKHQVRLTWPLMVIAWCLAGRLGD
jgi:hypothetical protein